MACKENNQPTKELQTVGLRELKFEVIEVRSTKTPENFLNEGIRVMLKEKIAYAAILSVTPEKKPTGTAKQDFDGTNRRKYTPTGFKIVCTKMLEALGFKLAEEHIVRAVTGHEDIFVVTSFPAAARA